MLLQRTRNPGAHITYGVETSQGQKTGEGLLSDQRGEFYPLVEQDRLLTDILGIASALSRAVREFPSWHGGNESN